MILDREPKSISPDIKPDMKLYFGEMFRVLRYQGNILSDNGMNMRRSGIDTFRELLITSVERIGKLNFMESEDIWQIGWSKLFSETKEKVDSGRIIPKSKLPEEYKKLFQDIRTLYFLSEEKVKEKGEHTFSFEGTPVGIPVTLIAEMLDKIVDSEGAKNKYEEIRGDEGKVAEFYTITKWQVDDLPQV